jgi:putative phage-type endonuclease
MKNRTGYIGSSDISCILGLNPYKSILQLWAEKTSQIPEPDLSGNEAVEWGTRLERIVSEKFAEKNGVKLIAYKKRFTHPKYPYISCELDNIVAGTDEIVEVKTCNMWGYKNWENEDDIPAHYIVQVQAALGLSGRKVGHFAVLCGGQRYLEKRIDFDKEMYDTMIERVVHFWETYIVPKVMPMTITKNDSDTLGSLFPVAEPVEIDLTDEANQLIEQIEACNQDLHNLTDIVNKHKNELKSLLKESESGKTNIYRVTWKNVVKKAHEVKESKYRELRFKKIKEGE